MTDHWTRIAAERIEAGENEIECLADYGYVPADRLSNGLRELRQTKDALTVDQPYTSVYRRLQEIEARLEGRSSAVEGTGPCDCCHLTPVPDHWQHHPHCPQWKPHEERIAERHGTEK